VEGSVAELTFYNPTATHTLTNKNKFSRAANNPFINKELTGKVIGIFNKAAYLSAHP
jgi:dihydroorotase-like cyclic amidohydrolase